MTEKLLTGTLSLNANKQTKYFQEEELRKEGGKYAHLNEDLHLMVECFAETIEAYSRITHAMTEVKKYLNPVSHFII